MTTSTRRRPLLIVIGVLIAGAVLTGGILTSCDRETPRPTPTPSVTTTPTPTPTPTPTVDPAEAEKQANIDEAKAAFLDYIQAVDRVWKNGGANFEGELYSLIGGETFEYTATYYPQIIAQGYVQTRDSKITSLEVTEYVADPTGAGHQQVHLRACGDPVDVIVEAGGAGGAPIDIGVLIDVLMQHQDDGRWTVDETTRVKGQTC